MTPTPLYLKQYETREIEVGLTDSVGAALPLGGATVEFAYAPTRTATPVVRKVATITESGTVKLTFSAEDTSIVGDYIGEWCVKRAGAQYPIPVQGFWDLYVRPSLLTPAL